MHSLLFYATALLLAYLPRTVSAPVYHQTVLGNPENSGEIIQTALKASNVIPDVLPKSFKPTVSLDLEFPSGHVSVLLGNTISVSTTKSRPTIAIRPLLSLPAESLSPTRTLAENKTYTIVLSDPDATSSLHPVKAQMCHWIATGLKATRLNATEAMGEDDGATHALDMSAARPMTMEDVFEDSNSFKELIEYMAPAPPKKTRKHRYVFVLLEPEAGGGGTDELQKPKERPHFGYGKQGKGVMDWAKDNGLVPVGANFFYAQNKKQ